MIDAEFRSEERFSRLSLAYTSDEEKEKVNSCVDKMIAKNKNIKPEMHTTKTSSGKEVLVIEYHDDLDRECGEIFENIMKELDIKNCD